MKNIKLLQTLSDDEKSKNSDLYSSGPYWKYKNEKAIYQIKKWGIEDFRGQSSGIATSYSDNIIYDVRNELNFKGRLVSKVFSLPLIKKVFKSQLSTTKFYIDSFLRNLSIVYKKNESVIKLIGKYKFDRTTEFGCMQKFNFNGKDYSTNYLDMAHRIDNLSKNLTLKKLTVFLKLAEVLVLMHIF